MSPEHALAVFVLALGLDLVFGDPPNRWHPVALMGRVIRGLAQPALAWRDRPGLQQIFGCGLVLAGAAAFSLPLLFLFPTRMPAWLDVALQALLLKCVFSLRSLLRAGGEVRRALAAGALDEARRLTAWHLVSRNTSALDAEHVASAAVESLSENITDSFLAPLLAFAVGGLPLAWAYRFINTADAMIAYRGEPFEHLGKCTAWLDDALNFVPARLGGVLVCLAAALCGQGGRGGLRVMAEQHGRTASPNAGWTMSAAAGALGVRLEKLDHYCLGAESARLPDGADLGRAERLTLAAAGLGGALCAIILILKG